MRISKLLNNHGRDFNALMECEHCNHTGKLTSGYDDEYYHNRVIPAMSCKSCGKNRSGELKHIDNGISPCSA